MSDRIDAREHSDQVAGSHPETELRPGDTAELGSGERRDTNFADLIRKVRTAFTEFGPATGGACHERRIARTCVTEQDTFVSSM